MKKVFIAVSCVTLAAGILFAQSIINGYRGYGGKPATHDPRTSPPSALPDAYALAVAHIAFVTNRFHCIAANCTEMTNRELTGWKFVFSNTNGDCGNVEVYFDKVVTSDFTRSHPPIFKKR